MVVVAFESLPCAGKSRILTDLAKEGVHIVEEVLDEKSESVPHGKRGIRPDDFYIASDMRKWEKAKHSSFAVMERSYLSTLAYGVCVGKYEEIRRGYAVLPEPDFIIYLDIPVTLSIQRQFQRKPHAKGVWTDEETCQRTVEFFFKEFEKRKGRVFIIDANRPYDEVLADVCRILDAQR